ncbi:DUF1489 family protein [Aliiroseovarius sp. PTFE2010]|uniref:DUF1489 family protein n=1 Tax=Aliiroseovarius sp. PTFE2010 TaxID=3417190 RepID=UPI003CF8ADB5
MDNSVINLVKLCVGANSVEDLAAWIAASGGRERAHTTRMRPKKEAQLLNGGSLYWVIKGVIQARQRVLRLDEVIGPDGIRRCNIVLDANLIRTENAARRPFQGWRYLLPEDSPRDLPKARASDSDLPPEMAQALAEIGLV